MKQNNITFYPNAITYREHNKEIAIFDEIIEGEECFSFNFKIIDGNSEPRCQHTPLRKIGAQTLFTLTQETSFIVSELIIFMTAYPRINHKVTIEGFSNPFWVHGYDLENNYVLVRQFESVEDSGEQIWFNIDKMLKAKD